MSILHVVPHNDARPHDANNGGQCECSPVVEPQENGDFLVIHSAWDGREIFEELENKGLGQ